VKRKHSGYSLSGQIGWTRNFKGLMDMINMTVVEWQAELKRTGTIRIVVPNEVWEEFQAAGRMFIPRILHACTLAPDQSLPVKES
jgi:hypothetical protein